MLQTANASVSWIHQPHSAVTMCILFDTTFLNEQKKKLGSVPEERGEATHQNVWTRKRRLKRVWHCQIL
ncbi:unnamed protein product [Pocillopora meandrina]|uniref:Uncharacterized protein n=1 Tax=Pocillopora meandrina TaxID=46732 RepID=A0AAU9WJI8_9CNID|nr:unnamed protein product [Pocillopora meandrina]